MNPGRGIGNVLPVMDPMLLIVTPKYSVSMLNTWKLFIKRCLSSGLANPPSFGPMMLIIHASIYFKEQGVYEDCRQCWGINYNAAIHQAAAAYNIPVAGVAEAWNGPNWDTDPNDLGYTKDGEHPNELGMRLSLRRCASWATNRSSLIYHVRKSFNFSSGSKPRS